MHISFTARQQRTGYNTMRISQISHKTECNV